MEGGKWINVIVHDPEALNARQELMKRTAEVYAESIFGYVKSLSCPEEQKRELLKEIMRRAKQKGR